MKIRFWSLVLVVMPVITLVAGRTRGLRNGIGPSESKPQSTAKWDLVWSDEFDSADGSLPDAKKWKHDIGGNGWGNHELEYYTNRTANASVRAGKLEITARREDYTGSDRVARQYTSARLKTQEIFAQAYGRFVARIKIPRGQGIWPAFWMLGDDIENNGWPACGEIDVMENVGKEPATIHGSLHGPGYSGDQDFTSIFHLPGGPKFADDFHEFSAEWELNVVRFSVDEHQYAEFRPARLPAGKKWVFDHPFFILLNVAVGGDWPGPPDANTQFPQTMLVDYVRVYKAASGLKTKD
jgi:beta-glucanase (GH16 family)